MADMGGTVMPNARFLSRLRQVIRLIGRDELVGACDLMEELQRETEQFRLFTRSPAFQPFCKFVEAARRSYRSSIEAYEANLVVLGYIQEDLRAGTRPRAKGTKGATPAPSKPTARRTRGTRR